MSRLDLRGFDLENFEGVLESLLGTQWKFFVPSSSSTGSRTASNSSSICSLGTKGGCTMGLTLGQGASAVVANRLGSSVVSTSVSSEKHGWDGGCKSMPPGILDLVYATVDKKSSSKATSIETTMAPVAGM